MYFLFSRMWVIVSCWHHLDYIFQTLLCFLFRNGQNMTLQSGEQKESSRQKSLLCFQSISIRVKWDDEGELIITFSMADTYRSKQAKRWWEIEPLSFLIQFWKVGAQQVFSQHFLRMKEQMNQKKFFFPFSFFHFTRLKKKKSLDSLFYSTSFCPHSYSLSLYLALLLRLTHLVSDCLSDISGIHEDGVRLHCFHAWKNVNQRGQIGTGTN